MSDSIPHSHEVTVASTQVRNPGVTTVRTVLQTVVAVVLTIVTVGPAIIDAILQEPLLPESLRGALLVIGAVIAAVAGILARIMAIPQVNSWLGMFGLGAPSTMAVGDIQTVVQIPARKSRPDTP